MSIRQLLQGSKCTYCCSGQEGDTLCPDGQMLPAGSGGWHCLHIFHLLQPANAAPKSAGPDFTVSFSVREVMHCGVRPRGICQLLQCIGSHAHNNAPTSGWQGMLGSWKAPVQLMLLHQQVRSLQLVSPPRHLTSPAATVNQQVPSSRHVNNSRASPPCSCVLCPDLLCINAEH